MRAVVQPLAARLGRRGPFLLFMGVGKICWGLGMILAPGSPAGLQLLTRFAPVHWWAMVWVVAGAATFASAFIPFARDGAGFLTASVPPALWGFAYGWAAVTGEYPRGVWIFLWYITSHCGVIWCASRVPPAPGADRPVRGAVEGRPR